MSVHIYSLSIRRVPPSRTTTLSNPIMFQYMYPASTCYDNCADSLDYKHPSRPRHVPAEHSLGKPADISWSSNGSSALTTFNADDGFPHRHSPHNVLHKPPHPVDCSPCIYGTTYLGSQIRDLRPYIQKFPSVKWCTINISRRGSKNPRFYGDIRFFSKTLLICMSSACACVCDLRSGAGQADGESADARIVWSDQLSVSNSSQKHVRSGYTMRTVVYPEVRNPKLLDTSRWEFIWAWITAIFL